MSELESIPLKRTPLFDAHRRQGARFVPFGGWEMPVQYRGLTEEHLKTRESAGLFDVSHMGEISVVGPGAETFLQFLTTNDVSKLKPGRAQYSMLLYPHGGVVDDIIIYRESAERFLICVNASNREKDFVWIESVYQTPPNNGRRFTHVEINDVSDSWAQIAIQGPRAREILATLVHTAGEREFVLTAAAFHHRKIKLSTSGGEIEALAATTGYTGEDGLELFVSSKDAVAAWNSMLSAGGENILPVGLGARDTLRLESCLPLYGHELSSKLTPLAAGLGWVVKMEKGDFVGKKSLTEELTNGPEMKLVGLEVVDPGIVREGAKIYAGGHSVGWVTSGTKPPTVGRAIALGYIPSKIAADGADLAAEVRGKQLRMKLVPLPFYKSPHKPTAKSAA